MGSHPLLMVNFKVYYSQRVFGSKPFANGGCQSLLQSTRMGSHPLLMVDVKVYYSQRKYIATFAETICMSSMNAFLKMFSLFERWQVSICKCTKNVFSIEFSIG